MMSNQLPTAEQTELETPIKISLSTRTDARTRLVRQVEIARGDGEAKWRWAAAPAVGSPRQKTNIVLKTREECASLFNLIAKAHPRSENSQNSLRRVRDTLDNELKRRALDCEETEDGKLEVVEIDGAGGEPPAHPPFDAGDIVNVTAGELGYVTTTEDGEKIPSTDAKSVTVDRLGSERILIRRRRSFSPVDHKLQWIPYDTVDSVAHDSMERRDRRRAIKRKRKQADKDALLALCKRHAKAEAERVWPGGTVPVDDITFSFNPRLSYHGGRYYPRSYYGADKPVPHIELCFDRYVNRGLGELLEIVRHELIHAWQDYHPDGHPPDAHKHHGRDFKQWIEPLNTH